MTTKDRFERWAKLHVGDAPQNFSGRTIGNDFWVYDDEQIETHWMCWKAALASVSKS